MPGDDREIQAALAASGRCWAEFPYYEKRYGDRGRRFSDSDACWLVTLTTLDPESLQKQVDWIGRVLATRGMPRLMLENMLRLLHAELASTVPDKLDAYDKLLRAADTLAEARRVIIPDTDGESLSREFDQAVGQDMAEMYKHTGALLVSSVADEKSGITGTVAAIKSWMTDTSRFPEPWTAAVNTLVEKAEQVSQRA